MATYIGVATPGTAAFNGTSNTNANPVRAVTTAGGWSAVYGIQQTSGAAAIHGEVSGTGGFGVYASGGSGYGVYAFNNSSQEAVFGRNSGGNGVVGISEGAGWAGAAGVTHHSSNGIGVLGSAVVPTGANVWAGYFMGKVYVSGALTKAGGGFIIDHPLDPENKTLEHSFVESPERKNMYDGVSVANDVGEITISLPAYFESLNTDFRYQLTPLGKPAALYVKHEISGGRFVIAGAEPGQRVSWLVTGKRKDVWAAANPLIVEAEKPIRERGTYLHPELFGQPPAKSVESVRCPRIVDTSSTLPVLPDATAE